MTYRLELQLSRRHGRKRVNSDLVDQTKLDYGMPLPTSIKVTLTNSLVEKMKKLEKVLIEEQVTEMQIISSRYIDKEHSHIDLFYNNEKMEVTKYESAGKYIPNFDQDCFHIVLSTLHDKSKPFSLSLMYVSDTNHKDIYTDNFSLDDLVLINHLTLVK